jgi:hypothetical protein
VLYKFNIMLIPFNRLIVQYLTQQIAQSVINNHSSDMFRPLRDRHQAGVYKATQTHQILSNICWCRVEI